MHAVRHEHPAVAWSVSRVRCVELTRGRRPGDWWRAFASAAGAAGTSGPGIERGPRSGHQGRDQVDGTRPGARRRTRGRGGRPRRRRARYRKIDAAAPGPGEPRRRCRRCPVRDRRGVDAAGRAASKATRRGSRSGAVARRDAGGVDSRGSRARPAPRRGHRFDSDHVHRRIAVRSGQRRAGPRECGAPPASREGSRRIDAAGRTRHQGRGACGTAGARTHGRHRALFRKRGGPPVPGDSGGQEPFRSRERDRPVRDDREGVEGGP